MAVGDAYVTVNEFKDSSYYKDLASFFDNDDTQIETFLLNVSDIINAYCRRHFWQETVTEKFRGRDTSKYFLKKYPVQSINSVIYIQPFTNNETSGAIAATEYEWTRDGKLESSTYFYSSLLYQVSYVYGYDEVPEEIKIATMMYAKFLADALDAGNFGLPDGASTSVFKYGKYSETYSSIVTKAQMKWDQQMPPVLAGMLKKYRRGGI